MATTVARIVGPRDGKLGKLGGIGIRFMVGGAESGGGFALVEHPMEPRALAAPIHRHSREDEYSFVLEGRVGADLGGEIVYGETEQPSREEVAAELILFVRETVRELGERRASSFLKKFYGWYLGHGRFPKPFKQELVQLASTEDVVMRLFAAAPGAAELLEQLERALPDPADEILLDDLPISLYGGG